MSEPAGGSASILTLESVVKAFHQGGRRLDVLRGASLSVAPGEMVGLVGPSGAGKSTLLHIAGLLERPDGGTVLIEGNAAGSLSDSGRTGLRRRSIGFVYQFHHLLPEFTAEENLALPQMIAGRRRSAALDGARELLGRVGLADRTGHRPAALSGGEQQRVAIARALVNRPRLLIADEPTGNLDHDTAEEVFALLLDLVHATGIGALVATHNLELAGRMDRVLELRDGRLVDHDGAVFPGMGRARSGRAG
ncbi:MAG: ABC transporter ATP-binding protein [Inquilinaceae bacterium]